MASIITQYYDALDGMSVSVNGTAVPVYNYDELLNNFNAFPVRLLTPIVEQSGDASPVTISKGGMDILWPVVDTCLLRPVNLAMGARWAVGGDMLEYQTNYLAAFNSLSIARGLTTEGLSFQTGVVTVDNRDLFFIDFVHRVRENL